MHCRHARRALSERMDGERLSSRAATALEQHLAGCAGCRAFEARAWRLRESARIELAPVVPDLIGSIMQAVASERPHRRGVLAPLRRAPSGASRRRLASLAPIAAALAVGLIAGSLSVGGPWRGSDRTTLASASAISHAVERAATRLTAYQARFAVTEHDPRSPVPVRELTMNVWFHAPERYRLDVVDHTAYGKSTMTTPNDLQLIVNGGSSYSVAPSPCPIGVCPQREVVTRNRLPFSPTSAAPTDLILPVGTLVDAQELRIVGEGTALGRDAVEVSLPFGRATPLFPFLELGGDWRPFFPGDRVDLWLDAHSWFPLRYSVYPARGPARADWELRFGLPEEPSGRAIFSVEALSVDASPPPSSTFRIPRTPRARDAGARAVSLAKARQEVDFTPLAPSEVGGLSLYRVVVPKPRAKGEEPDQTVVTYSKGLAWLKVGETHAAAAGAFFGPIGPQAQQVSVPQGGVAYYEPSTEDHGRRLAIHTVGADLYLETNLSRDDLLSAAAALPVEGIPVPEGWVQRSSPLGRTERVSIDQAASAVAFTLLLPAEVPAPYHPVSAELVHVNGNLAVSVFYEREDADFGAGPLRLHEELGTQLPPSTSPDQTSVDSNGFRGRWTPEGNRLEWVVGGVYCSLEGGDLPLRELLFMATSLQPYPPTTATTSPASATPTPSSSLPASPDPSPQANAGSAASS